MPLHTVMLNYVGEHKVLRPLPDGSDSNYKQRCGHKVLHRQANNELHNSDEKSFMAHSLPGHLLPGTFAPQSKMAWELLFPGSFVLKSIRSQERSHPVMSMTLIYDIRLDCVPCYVYILMIYCCCWHGIAWSNVVICGINVVIINDKSFCFRYCICCLFMLQHAGLLQTHGSRNRKN